MIKKLPVILLCTTLFTAPLYAQQVTEQTVEIGKERIPAFVATSNNKADQVKELIQADLDKGGITKHKKIKRYYTYTGIVFPAINNDNKIDLRYKVEKSRKRSTVYFIVSRGYDNYVTSATDPVVTANINKYLGGLDEAIAKMEEIRAKEKEVAKMNKELEKQKEELRKAEEEKKKKQQEIDAAKQSR